MRPPVSREKIYSVMFDREGLRIPEIARITGLNYTYTYQVVRSLVREGYVTVVRGRVVFLDRKGFLFKWAGDKERILGSLGYTTVKLIPDYDLRELVLFSGNSALWLFGKIISPAGGILYTTADRFEDVMELKDPNGYPFKLYIYDEFYFRIRKELSDYYIPSWGMIVADTLVQGMYARLFDDVFETVVSIIKGGRDEEA